MPKYKTRFWTAYLGENVIHFSQRCCHFFGYFINEPTKSSLIGEKSTNLVTLLTAVKSFITLAAGRDRRRAWAAQARYVLRHPRRVVHGLSPGSGRNWRSLCKVITWEKGNLGPGAWGQGHGARGMGPGAWSQRHMEPGHGAWDMVPGALGLGAWDLEPGFRARDLGSKTFSKPLIFLLTFGWSQHASVCLCLAFPV